jgi:aminoglycoside phosphotransferase (APT) family kinase protein
MDPYVEITHRVAPGAALVRRWPLRGGVSAHVEALELALPDGSERRVVVRRHGAAHWKALTRDVTVVEYQLLSALSAAGLAVPLPLWVETGSELLGSPFFVMAYVDGAPELDPSELPSALAQMAEYLHRVHTLSVDVALPPREDPVAGALSFVAETDPVYEVLRSLSTQAPTSALVHGDYWPGNVLWKAGKPVAVLDWEDAAYGDPVSDLAGCRLELLWKYERRGSFQRALSLARAAGHHTFARMGALRGISGCCQHERLGTATRSGSRHAQQSTERYRRCARHATTRCCYSALNSRTRGLSSFEPGFIRGSSATLRSC